MTDIDRNLEELGSVSKLGNKSTKYKDTYDPTILETFDNKHPDNDLACINRVSP